MAKLAQRLDFNLADTLARDVEVLADFFQRPLAAIRIQTEAQANYLFFARAERLQHITGDVARVRTDHPFSRTHRGLVLDEISDLRFAGFANWRLERNRVLDQVQRLAYFVGRALHSFGNLFGAWLAAEFDNQFASHFLNLIDHFNHVNRHADSPRLIGNRAGDRLANPPRRVGRKLITATPVKLLDALHQTQVSLLNQIEKLQTAILIFLGDRDDQPQ